jgi:DNA recombination protein RmuC
MTFAMIVSLVTPVLALLAAIFAVCTYWRRPRMSAEELAQLRLQVDEAIRAETGRLRGESAEQARALRQEIAESIRGFQSSIMEAFRGLGDPLQEQMRALDQTISAGLRASEERIGTIAQQIEEQQLRLVTSSAEAQAVLRSQIDTRLDQFTDKSALAARELREELSGSMQRLLEAMTQGLRASEERGLEIGRSVEHGLLRLATSASESQNTLREQIESRLDAFGDRSSNSARDLREELSTATKCLQESLANTLDARLTELTQTTSSHGQGIRTELHTGLQAISSAVRETLQLISQQQVERLDVLDQKVRSLIEQHGTAQEALKQVVETRLDKLRTENSQKLDEMRHTVDERLQSTLESRITESFRIVSQQLESVHKGLGEMQTLAAGVGDLKKVLSNVKVRGTWGEIQLGNLLEQFLSPDQYVHNAQIRSDSQERVEYAIRMPGRGDEKECLMPIDAKFPQEDYARLIAAADAGDGAGVEQAASALESRVKGFAKSIREKYIYSPLTTEFAILFLPTESLYAEMLRRPGLFETLQREHHVLLASPTTLAAMLNAFQMGFRSLAIEKRSAEVWQVLGAVRTEFAKHGDVVDTLRNQLNRAVNTIDKLGTRTRVMTRALRGVDALPEESATALLAFTAETASDEAGEAEIEHTAVAN